MNFRTTALGFFFTIINNLLVIINSIYNNILITEGKQWTRVNGNR